LKYFAAKILWPKIGAWLFCRLAVLSTYKHFFQRGEKSYLLSLDSSADGCGLAKVLVLVKILAALFLVVDEMSS